MPSRSGRGVALPTSWRTSCPDRMCEEDERNFPGIQGAPGTPQQTRRGPEPVPAGCGAAEAAETGAGAGSNAQLPGTQCGAAWFARQRTKVLEVGTQRRVRRGEEL